MKACKYFGIFLFFLTLTLIFLILLPHFADTHALGKTSGAIDYLYDILVKGMPLSILVGGLGIPAGLVYYKIGKEGRPFGKLLWAAISLHIFSLLLLSLPLLDLIIRVACEEEDLLWPYILLMLLSFPAGIFFGVGVILAFVSIRRTGSLNSRGDMVHNQGQTP